MWGRTDETRTLSPFSPCCNRLLGRPRLLVAVLCCYNVDVWFLVRKHVLDSLDGLVLQEQQQQQQQLENVDAEGGEDLCGLPLLRQSAV